MKVRITADSTCDLTEELVARYGITITPLTVSCGGESYLDGVEIDPDRLFDVRRTVGLVLQNPDNQLVSSIVEEDVAFGPENLGLIRRKAAAKPEKYCADKRSGFYIGI